MDTVVQRGGKNAKVTKTETRLNQITLNKKKVNSILKVKTYTIKKLT